MDDFSKKAGFTLKPFKGMGRVRGATRRTVRGAKSAVNNRTSTPGSDFHNEGGARPFRSHDYNEGPKGLDPEMRDRNLLVGGVAGLAAGGSAGAIMHGSQGARDAKVHNQYNRAKAKEKFGKADKYHLITDVGTAAGKTAKGKRWPGLSPAHIAGAATVTGGATYGIDRSNRKYARKQIEAARRKQYQSGTFGKRAVLETYTPSKKENAKYRAKQGAISGGIMAGVIGAERGLKHGAVAATNAANAKQSKAYGYPAPPKMKLPKVSSRNKKLAAGLVVGSAALSAAGKHDKKQYRVVNKSSMSAFGVDHG